MQQRKLYFREYDRNKKIIGSFTGSVYSNWSSLKNFMHVHVPMHKFFKALLIRKGLIAYDDYSLAMFYKKQNNGTDKTINPKAT